MLILTLLKSFFGVIVTNVVENPKVLVTVVVVAIALFVAFKVHQTEQELTAAKQQVVLEQQNNKTLQGNVMTLQAANDQNKLVIEQLSADKQSAINSVSNLTAVLSRTNQALGTVQTAVNSIKVAPVKLSPYIVQAIDGIQQARKVPVGASK